jgi:hypothetical protein
LGYIPILIVFTYGLTKQITIELEAINGVLATNGIILGFWATVLALPKKENITIIIGKTFFLN